MPLRRFLPGRYTGHLVGASKFVRPAFWPVKIISLYKPIHESSSVLETLQRLCKAHLCANLQHDIAIVIMTFIRSQHDKMDLCFFVSCALCLRKNEIITRCFGWHPEIVSRCCWNCLLHLWRLACDFSFSFCFRRLPPRGAVGAKEFESEEFGASKFHGILRERKALLVDK